MDEVQNHFEILKIEIIKTIERQYGCGGKDQLISENKFHALLPILIERLEQGESRFFVSARIPTMGNRVNLSFVLRNAFRKALADYLRIEHELRVSRLVHVAIDWLSRNLLLR